MAFNLHSSDLDNLPPKVVVIDYDNKAQTFGHLQPADYGKTIGDAALFVFLGPDAKQSVAKEKFPKGTTFVCVPTAASSMSQAVDNEIVMFITAIALKTRNANYNNSIYYSGNQNKSRHIYLVAGGDKRYDALEALVNGQFPLLGINARRQRDAHYGVHVSLVDSSSCTIYTLISDVQCKSCSLFLPFKKEHTEWTCKACNESSCTFVAHEHDPLCYTKCSDYGCKFTFTKCQPQVGESHLSQHQYYDILCPHCAEKDKVYYKRGSAEYRAHMVSKHPNQGYW